MNKSKPEPIKRHTPPDHISALLHDINRISMEQIKNNCPELKRSCRLILMELSHKDNVTQLDLVRATHLKAPTVSVSLQKMEKDGLVLRRQDEEDLRATRVFLTENGRKLDQQIISKLKEHDTAIENCLTPEEKKIMLQLLKKIRNNLIGGS